MFFPSKYVVKSISINKNITSIQLRIIKIKFYLFALIILIFIKTGNIIPLNRITEAEKNAKTTSILGNIKAKKNTIITGSIEYSL